MELTRENFRVMIYYHFRRGLLRQECKFKSTKIKIKSSIIRIIISKTDITISFFDKIIRKISIVTIKYHDSFLRRFTLHKSDILLIELWKE